MNKEQFDKIFKDCVISLGSKDLEEIESRLKPYSSNNEKIPGIEFAIFVYMESKRYSEELIYSVLTKVLEIED